MVKSCRKQKFVNGLQFSFQTALKENKIKIIFSCLIVVASIIFGVVVAVKTNMYDSFKSLQELDVKGFESGFVASSSAFLSRCFSLLFNLILLTLCSFSIFTIPFAEVLLAYRSYLFGLNFALIFVFYGLGSMITAIVVILPCQIVTTFVLIMFFVLFSKLNSNCNKFGSAECNRFVFFLIGFLILFLLNLTETILLVLLNGKVILVI